MAGKEEDLYLVLGLENGLESTEAEVKKAYRKKALESHPDKRPDDKNAAAEFDRIQKAYEVLGDEKARKAYDDLRKVQRARADRDAAKGAKRQKMMDDLKKREEAYVHERSAEEMARMKLKAEIARVRQENIARQKRQQEELAAVQEVARRASGGVASTPGYTPGAESTILQGATLARTLKVTWDRSREGALEDYGAEKLRKAFLKFGAVEDIIMKEEVKKKKKGSALVVMESEAGAAEAIGAVCGDLSNPLLVKPAVPGLVPGKGGSADDSNEPPGSSARHADGNIANGIGVEQVDLKGVQTSGVNRGETSRVHGAPTTGVNGTGTNGAETDGRSGAQEGVGDGVHRQGAAHGNAESGAGASGVGQRPGITGSQRPNIFANGPPRPLFPGAGNPLNQGTFSEAAAAASSGTHKDYENVTLMRMRQAAERARLIREMEEQDAQDAEAEKVA